MRFLGALFWLALFLAATAGALRGGQPGAAFAFFVAAMLSVLLWLRLTRDRT